MWASRGGRGAFNCRVVVDGWGGGWGGGGGALGRRGGRPQRVGSCACFLGEREPRGCSHQARVPARRGMVGAPLLQPTPSSSFRPAGLQSSPRPWAVGLGATHDAISQQARFRAEQPARGEEEGAEERHRAERGGHAALHQHFSQRVGKVSIDRRGSRVTSGARVALGVAGSSSAPAAPHFFFLGLEQPVCAPLVNDCR